MVSDPAWNSGGVVLLAARPPEANILAYNDMFLLIAILALLLLLWGITIEIRMRRRGEISPIVLLAQRLAAMTATAQNEGHAPS